MRLTEFLHQVNKYSFLIERDVMNAGEIKKWVATISSRVMEPQVQKWFQSQLYQFLINRFNLRSAVQQIRQVPPGAPDWLVKKIEDGGEPIYNIEISPNFTENAMAVIDYINAWSQDNPGREPRMRWEQAAEQSGKWHHDMQKVAVSAEENEQDLAEVVTLYEFKDGFKWVDVNTEVCLKREGSRMGHCVGGYGPHIAAGTTKIFSLRSSKNIPHATLEATSDKPTTVVGIDNQQGDMFSGEGNLPPLKVEQIKGRTNEPPVAKYIPYVKEFLEWGNFEMGYGGSNDLEKMGLYVKQGKYYSLDEVSKVFKKYKDGYTWVKLDDDVELDHGGGMSLDASGSPYKLITNDGNIIASATTDKEGTVNNVTTNYHGTKADRKAEREEIKPKVLDLLNAVGVIPKQGPLSNQDRFKKDWGIYSHDGKHGELHNVAEKVHDLPNGNKAVKASGSYYVVNDKNQMVFEYSHGIADINLDKTSFNVVNLNMNFNDLLDALSEATGEDIDESPHSVKIPRDQDGNKLEPKGEPTYSNRGVSWYNETAPDALPTSIDSSNVYIGYDKHKNPLYYVETEENPAKKNNPMNAWASDIAVDDIGFLMGGNFENTMSYKPGEDIISLILDQEWDTDGETFKETMYEEFMWIEDDHDTWWRAEDDAPAKYEQITYNGDGDEEDTWTEDNATLDMFWSETSLQDSGMDSPFFIEMYARFFGGEWLSWDDRDMQRTIEDPETGEYTEEYYSVDYNIKFTGKEDDYKHPDQT